MPRWSFTRRRDSGDKPAPPPVASKPPPAIPAQPNVVSSSAPARRAGDTTSDGRPLQLQFEEATATQARLRQDLAELLKAHRQQGRVLARNQKLLEQTENEISRHRSRTAALECEVAEQRNVADQHATRVKELEHIVASHATLQTAYEALDRERQDLTARLADLTKSRANATADRDRIRAQLAEAEQAVKTSQATIKAAQRLSSSVEWRGALDGVLDAASELVRFERGTLALVDELQEELKVEAARNSPIAISEMSRFKVGEGIAGWALSHREPVLVRDSRTDARFKASDPKHQPRSFVAVPLLADKEGLGVLTLARSASDPFTEQDLRNLARVATDASNALINARLVDLLKQREDHLTTLVRKARELSTANDSKQVVEFVLSSARELIGGETAPLAPRQHKKLGLEVGGPQGVADVIIQQRIAWGAPAAGDVMRGGKAWVSPMRDMLPPNLVETVEGAGLKMIVSVLGGAATAPEATDEGALLSRSEVETSDVVSGVLNVYRDSLDPIPAGDLEQLKAFAQQAAVAIQNVRRWDRVKEQLQATSSMNTRLMGRERYINQLLFRIQQLEQELSRYKAA